MIEMPSKFDKKYFYYLLIIALVYAAFFIINGLLCLWAYASSIIDLGTFDQILWMASKGMQPTTSINYPLQPDKPWLGFHFSLLIFLLAPLYLISAQPEWLVLVHVLCISLTVIPIYFCCIELGFTNRQSMLWGIVYLTNCIVIYSSLWEFHEQSLAVPLVAICMWATLTRKNKILFLALFALALTKEHYGATIAAFGVFYGLYHKEWKVSSSIFVCGALVFYIIVFIIMPFFNNGEHPMLNDSIMQAGERHIKRYFWLKWELKEAIGHGLRILISHFNIFLYAFLFLPLLLLPFAKWIYLIPMMPEFALNILSDFEGPRNISSYYYSTIVPILVIAAAAGCMNIKRKFLALRTSELIYAVLLVNMIVFMVIMPKKILPDFSKINSSNFFYSEELLKVKKLLPNDLSLAASSNIGVYFSHRKTIIPLARESKEIDAMVVYLEQPVIHNGAWFNPIGKKVASDNAPFSTLILALQDPHWGVSYYSDYWLVLKRNSPSVVPREIVRTRLEKIYSWM